MADQFKGMSRHELEQLCHANSIRTWSRMPTTLMLKKLRELAPEPERAGDSDDKEEDESGDANRDDDARTEQACLTNAPADAEKRGPQVGGEASNSLSDPAYAGAPTDPPHRSSVWERRYCGIPLYIIITILLILTIPCLWNKARCGPSGGVNKEEGREYHVVVNDDWE